VDESLPEVLMPLIAAHHAGEKLVLLFDYDGTLTPFAEFPWLAKLAPRTHDLLAQLAALPRVHVGIVSGRRLDDVMQMVDLPGLYYGGLSGIELNLKGISLIHPAAPQGAALIDEIVRRLSAIEQVYPGAWVENKRYGLTLHYRGVAPAQAEEVHARVMDFLGSWGNQLRILDDPKAVEVTLSGTWTKADAVRKIVAHVGEPAFVFCADASDDGGAFAAVTALGGITVGVGPKAPPSATGHAADPDTLVEWLDALLHALASATVAP
jgi:trehalose-phosphatase